MSESPDSSGSLGPPEAPEPPPGNRRGRPLGPAAPLLVVLLAVAALASIAYFFTRGAPGPRSRKASGSVSRKTGIAIFPLVPSPGAEEVAWVGQAAFQFLPFVMEDSADLRVLTPERLHDLARGDPPEVLSEQRELAQRGGADFLLHGEVSGKPGEAALKASWVEAGSGREMARWEVSGIRPDNLGRKLDELYAHLRQSLRLDPLGPTDPPLSSLVPVKEAPTRSYLISAALLAKGDANGCLEGLKEALTLPDFHLAYFLEAEAAARAGKPQTAVAAASRISKVTRPLPARVTLLTPVILAIYGSGNPRGAVGPLESFLARFPDEKYPRSWLGAIEVLLLNDPERARENLKRSLDLDPSNLEARRLLGQATLAAGHPEEAAPILQEFLKSQSDNDPARLLLADAFRQAGRFEDARREVEEVLSRQPENSRAVGLLGSVYLEQGKTREAEALYTKLARSSKPGVQSQGEAFLARSCLLQGRFQEALRHYRTAADEAGQGGDRNAQADTLLELADVQSYLGMNAEALATLGDVRGVDSRADPDMPMINVIVAQKQFDTARKLMDEQANRWQGRVSGAVLARLRDSLEATIALEQGKYADAVKKIQASYVGTDKEPPASEILGRAYLGAGDAVRAEKIFRDITRDPERFQDPLRYVRCVIRLGEAREKLGKRQEALQSYREALRWWGSADLPLPVISEAREGLKRLAK
jgi:tetratricopeptide (TPR) repeat protein